VGRASLVKEAELARLCQLLGPEHLASLVCAALKTRCLGVTVDMSPTRLFGTLLDLLPLSLRLEFSCTTGLKVSPQRPVRLAILPDNREEQRQAIRVARLTHVDLSSDLPAKYAPKGGWPLLIYDILRSRQFSNVTQVVQATAHAVESDSDLLAEQVRQQFESTSEPLELFMPFS
jgi:hypothetical protein